MKNLKLNAIISAFLIIGLFFVGCERKKGISQQEEAAREEGLAHGVVPPVQLSGDGEDVMGQPATGEIGINPLTGEQAGGESSPGWGTTSVVIVKPSTESLHAGSTSEEPSTGIVPAGPHIEGPLKEGAEIEAPAGEPSIVIPEGGVIQREIPSVRITPYIDRITTTAKETMKEKIGLISGISTTHDPFERDNLHQKYFSLSCAALDSINVINVKCLGAKGDGSLSDAPIIENLINTIGISTAHLILFPAGTYVVTKPLSGMHLELLGELVDGEIAATIKVADMVSTTTPLPYVLRTNYQSIIENIKIDANNRADEGVRTFKFHGGGWMKNVKVEHSLKTAFHLDTSMVVNFRNLSAVDNRGDGIWAESCNAMMLYDADISNNGGVGLKISSSTTDGMRPASGGMFVSGGKIFDNKGDAQIMILGTSSVVRIGGVSVKGPKAGLIIDGSEISGTNVVLAMIYDNTFEYDGSGNGVDGIVLLKKQMNLYNPNTFAVYGGFDNIIKNNTFINVPDNIPDIKIDGYFNWIIANSSVDALGTTKPARVSYSDRNIVWNRPEKTLLCFNEQCESRAYEFMSQPPDTTSWHVDDVIFNKNPDSETPGWVCSTKDADGKCAWSVLGN